MIQRKSNKNFVALTKNGPITISDKSKCIRLHDEKSAFLFMHYLIQTYGVIADQYNIGMEHELGEPDKPERSLLTIDNKNSQIKNRFSNET